MNILYTFRSYAKGESVQIEDFTVLKLSDTDFVLQYAHKSTTIHIKRDRQGYSQFAMWQIVDGGKKKGAEPKLEDAIMKARMYAWDKVTTEYLKRKDACQAK